MKGCPLVDRIPPMQRVFPLRGPRLTRNIRSGTLVIYYQEIKKMRLRRKGYKGDLLDREHTNKSKMLEN